MYYNQLSVQEKSLVEQQVTNNKKSVLVAYILWFFLGMTGAHRFYASKGKVAAIIQLVSSIIGFLTTFIFIGFLILFVLGVWVLIDAFLIPGMVRKQADELRELLSKDVLTHNNGRYSNRQEEDLEMDF